MWYRGPVLLALMLQSAVGLAAESGHELPLSAGQAGLLKVAAAEAGINLPRAEQLAVQRDAIINKYTDEAEAMDDKAVAARQNPDPRFRIGVMNVPTDTFDLAQEAMTQQVVGVQQMFPAGSKLTHMGNRLEFMGKAMRARADEQGLSVRRDVRNAWLDIYQQHHATNIIKQSQKVFAELAEIVRFQYRAGRGNQQDVLRAQLEMNMLLDKELEIAGMKEMALARLAKLVGPSVDEAGLQLGSLSLPPLPAREQLNSRLQRHPMVNMKEQMSNSAQAAIDVARASYKLGWGLDISYGFRQESPQGMARADMMSAIIMIDLPFFTANRQDKLVAASEREYTAARSDVEEARRMLQARLDGLYDKMVRLQQRLALYRDTVLPESSQNAEAALKAYQSQATDFTPLMRARLMELNNKLTALKLLVEHAQTQVELLYLAGEKM